MTACSGTRRTTRASRAASNVIYTGAAPNQHIVPLAEYMLRSHGRRAFCIGSNYIWAWENNKIMREAVLAAGGTVLAERYFPVGETDFDGVIDQILGHAPKLRLQHADRRSPLTNSSAPSAAPPGAADIDQVTNIPIASCSLSEPELVEIGSEACDGHVSSSVYFESIDTGAEPRIRVGLSAALPRRRPDVGRC